MVYLARVGEIYLYHLGLSFWYVCVLHMCVCVCVCELFKLSKFCVIVDLNFLAYVIFMIE
jgi:hypothetical protein